MRNISFVAWVLGWPWLLSAYPGDEPLSEAALAVFTLIWIAVSCLVYEPRVRQSPTPDALKGDAK